jgi:hypothetical protein
MMLAYLEGFEPPTFWSVARRSIQLSYRYARAIDESIHYANKRDFQIGGGENNGKKASAHPLILWTKMSANGQLGAVGA